MGCNRPANCQCQNHGLRLAVHLLQHAALQEQHRHSEAAAVAKLQAARAELEAVRLEQAKSEAAAVAELQVVRAELQFLRTDKVEAEAGAAEQHSRLLLAEDTVQHLQSKASPHSLTCKTCVFLYASRSPVMIVIDCDRFLLKPRLTAWLLCTCMRMTTVGLINAVVMIKQSCSA